MKIANLNAIQILDSRGNPTIQVEVLLQDGSKGIFKVPSGASTGIHEAHELRDNNKNYYHGKSVEVAVENVLNINSHFMNKEFTQKELDDFLKEIDGTENKEILGANAILGVSIAFAKANAISIGVPLYKYLARLVKEKTNLLNQSPSLFCNVINGGLHAQNGLKVQEFMLIPLLNNLQSDIRAVCEIYQTLKKNISKKYGGESTSVGDEGGFAPNINTVEEALDLLVQSINECNYEGKVALALDAAASDFYSSESKKYEIESKKMLDYKELTQFYNNLIKKYPIISIEDPMAEDDFEGFAYFLKNIESLSFKNPLTGMKIPLVVGDDLLVTNPKRVELAKEKKLCNSLLLKINQIGTLTESIDAHLLSKGANWHTIVSHRSGETGDSFISDLAVALKSSIKLGAPCRGERVAKYNRLLEIYR